MNKSQRGIIKLFKRYGLVVRVGSCNTNRYKSLWLCNWRFVLADLCVVHTYGFKLAKWPDCVVLPLPDRSASEQVYRPTVSELHKIR